MATRFNSRLGAAVLAGSMLVSVLAGCGTTGAMTAPDARLGASVQAAEAAVLKKALERIHRAVFAKLDLDANKKIDEYEAGPNLTLKDFKAADKNKNHNLTYSEFKKYAVTELFFFKDSPEQFQKRFRRDLGTVFRRLDENRDGQLVKNEVSNTDLKKLRLTFEYPRLGIKVPVQKCTPEAFAAADRTGDAKLGEAEFEDFYIEAVVAALGGDGGATPPAPQPDPGTEPGTDPGADPAPPAEEPAGEWAW